MATATAAPANGVRRAWPCLFGGREAELILGGDKNVTNGAMGDIQMATQLARAMITEWGMSEKLGRVRYSANEQEVFLGHSVTQSKNVSEGTAQIIDEEVRRLIHEGEAQAKSILKKKREDLHVVAKALAGIRNAVWRGCGASAAWRDH